MDDRIDRIRDTLAQERDIDSRAVYWLVSEVERLRVALLKERARNLNNMRLMRPPEYFEAWARAELITEGLLPVQ